MNQQSDSDHSPLRVRNSVQAYYDAWTSLDPGVSKNRGTTPKMAGENNGKTLVKWDDLGGKPQYFRKHPKTEKTHVTLVNLCFFSQWYGPVSCSNGLRLRRGGFFFGPWFLELHELFMHEKLPPFPFFEISSK